jgi:hypothetical protein
MARLNIAAAKPSFRATQADFLFSIRSCGMVGPRSEEISFPLLPARAQKSLHSNALWSCPSEPAFLRSLFRRLYYICTSSLQLISPPRVML